MFYDQEKKKQNRIVIEKIPYSFLFVWVVFCCLFCFFCLFEGGLFVWVFVFWGTNISLFVYQLIRGRDVSRENPSGRRNTPLSAEPSASLTPENKLLSTSRFPL